MEKIDIKFYTDLLAKEGVKGLQSLDSKHFVADSKEFTNLGLAFKIYAKVLKESSKEDYLKTEIEKFKTIVKSKRQTESQVGDKVEVEPVVLGIRQPISLGLVICEIVTFALPALIFMYIGARVDLLISLFGLLTFGSLAIILAIYDISLYKNSRLPNNVSLALKGDVLQIFNEEMQEIAVKDIKSVRGGQKIWILFFALFRTCSYGNIVIKTHSAKYKVKMVANVPIAVKTIKKMIKENRTK